MGCNCVKQGKDELIILEVDNQGEPNESFSRAHTLKKHRKNKISSIDSKVKFLTNNL